MAARKRKNACKCINKKSKKKPEPNQRKLKKCDLNKKLKSALPKNKNNKKRIFGEINYSKNVYYKKRLKARKLKYLLEFYEIKPLQIKLSRCDDTLSRLGRSTDEEHQIVPAIEIQNEQQNTKDFNKTAKQVVENNENTSNEFICAHVCESVDVRPACQQNPFLEAISEKEPALSLPEFDGHLRYEGSSDDSDLEA